MPNDHHIVSLQNQLSDMDRQLKALESQGDLSAANAKQTQINTLTEMLNRALARAIESEIYSP